MYVSIFPVDLGIIQYFGSNILAETTSWIGYGIVGCFVTLKYLFVSMSQIISFPVPKEHSCNNSSLLSSIYSTRDLNSSVSISIEISPLGYSFTPSIVEVSSTSFIVSTPCISS